MTQAPPRARRRLVRRLGVLVCSLAVFLVASPGTAAARGPARPAAPLVSTHPDFVTETDELKWDDCIWASGAMLIQEWTGRVVDRAALRAASGAGPKGGSSLIDLRRGALRLLGLDVAASPSFGDRMTWRQLLSRLSHGGGAVVVGWYGSLPARLTRWDRKLAAMEPTEDAGHAMFVTDYRPKTGKLWLMDPLGRGDYVGEWVDARVIREFVWTSSWGYIYAAATPIPRAVRSPLKAVTLGAPAVLGAARAGTAALVSIPVSIGAHGSIGSILPGLRAEATFEPLAPSLLSIASHAPAAASASPGPSATAAPTAAAQALDVGASEPWVAGPAPNAPMPAPAPAIAGQPVTGTATGLTFSAALPSVAGAYRIGVRLLDARGHRLRGAAASLAIPVATVTVWDEYGAVYAADAATSAEPDGATPLLVRVLNAGSRDWIPLPDRAGDARFSTDQVVASWVERPDLAPTRAALVLPAGSEMTVSMAPTAPTIPGVYHLSVDVVDPVAGSFAALGVPPLLITVTVAAESGAAF